MNKIRSHFITAAILTTAIVGNFPGMTWADATNNGDASVNADNSRMNAQTPKGTPPTADQAQNGPSDREIMRQIRRQLVQDKTLSTYAQNVKIIAQQGHVTLKGTVHTEEEKNNVGAKAASVAGADHITNNLTVKGS